MKTILFSSILFVVIHTKTVLPSHDAKYYGVDQNNNEYVVFSTDTTKHVGDTLYYKNNHELRTN